MAPKLSKAIFSRFLERMINLRKGEVLDVLRHSGQSNLAKRAPKVVEKISSSLRSGATCKDAVWEAISDSL